MAANVAARPRARELGIEVGTLEPGAHNGITDVPGVCVGHCTLIEGEGPRLTGIGPVRTGVTVVMPVAEPWRRPVFAGTHRLNGNGELTGLEWLRESGLLTTFVGLTNTHSVGVVRDALVAHEVSRRTPGELFFSLPVVGETFDGMLNDINGFHVRAGHVEAAIAAAVDGPVAEGSVGGGTGMICHGFKGGIGTASRRVPAGGAQYTIGVLVQANHGARSRLTVNGVPIGESLGVDVVPAPPFPDEAPPGTGSIIVVVATDAPLLPLQCKRLAQRAGLGVARTGGAGEHGSGDIFLSFATGNTLPAEFTSSDAAEVPVRVLSNEHITALFYATIEATEEAILGAMLASDTMVGADGTTAHALPADRLCGLLTRAGRMRGPSPTG